MDIKETIAKMKQLLAAAPDATDANPDMAGMADYVLEDGTKISVDKCEVGGAVTINGNPAPDGEHKLQDGTILETKDGKIVEIQAPGEVSDDQGADVNTDMSKFESQFTEINGKFASYEEKFAAYESRFKSAEETIGKQQQAIGQLLEVVEKLASTPVSEPAAPAQNAFTAQKNEAKEERFSAILSALKEIKK
jgi:hypothetical protein